MNGQNGIYPALIPATVVLAEVAAIDLLYWARVTTFVGTPGRFRTLEPMLRSDIVVFALIPIVGTVALGQIISHAGKYGKRTGYAAGAVLSGVALAVAMLIGFNTWGT